MSHRILIFQTIAVTLSLLIVIFQIVMFRLMRRYFELTSLRISRIEQWVGLNVKTESDES